MTNYKRPESVLVLVYTEQAETLLLRRINPPAGVWQSVTGSLADAESLEAAASRELIEETGLVAQPMPTGESYRYDIVPEARALYAPGVIENHETVFEFCLPQRQTIHIDSNEHSEYCWLPLVDAVEQVWSWSNRTALESLKSRILNT